MGRSPLSSTFGKWARLSTTEATYQGKGSEGADYPAKEEVPDFLSPARTNHLQWYHRQVVLSYVLWWDGPAPPFFPVSIVAAPLGLWFSRKWRWWQSNANSLTVADGLVDSLT